MFTNYRNKPPIQDYVLRYCKPHPSVFLAHHGVKGQKWGVRRTPEELGHPTKNVVEKTDKHDIIKSTVSGHKSTPKQGPPYGIIDHVTSDGFVDIRSFYNETGWKDHDIHTTNHGNPKQHPYGEHGEHIEEYEWNDDGSLRKLSKRELTLNERKENQDIL